MAPGEGDGRGAVHRSDGDRVRAEISPEALRPEEARRRAAEPGAGAVVLFVGTVRRRNRDREVTALEYEAYGEMAAEELGRVGREARERFGLLRVEAVHRVGRLVPGDAAVAVAASSEHRAAAFEGARWLMDELKRRVPIWKRESYEDGSSEWLGGEAARPADAPSETSVGGSPAPTSGKGGGAS